LAIYEAKQRADESARKKSEFLANMSHENRTSINGVIGITELLRRTSLDVRQARCVRAIHSSGQALLRQADGVLDFSKIEAGPHWRESPRQDHVDRGIPIERCRDCLLSIPAKTYTSEALC
jgi:signal transduction histidine kinase